MLRRRRMLVLAGILSSCILSARSVSCAEPTLKVGDMAPAFECKDSEGLTWNSQDFIGKQMLAVYFYPSDFASCCTCQARGYRDQLGKLAAAGVKVVGISCDQALAHQYFKKAYGLEFTLLSDEQGDVARSFGVPLRSGGKALVKDPLGQEVRDPDVYCAAGTVRGCVFWLSQRTSGRRMILAWLRTCEH